MVPTVECNKNEIQHTPVNELCKILDDAYEKKDWVEILRWTSRIDEFFACGICSDECKASLLSVFCAAYTGTMPVSYKVDGLARVLDADERGYDLHVLMLRHAEVLHRLERYRDEGELICSAADCIYDLGRFDDCIKLYSSARSIAEGNGFFTVECVSCKGLGLCYLQQGRVDEGFDLLRNAFATAPLCEHSKLKLEFGTLDTLTHALYEYERFTEIEALLPQLKLVSKRISKEFNSLDLCELNYYILSAHIYEARGDFAKSTDEMRELGKLLRDKHDDVMGQKKSFMNTLEHAVTTLDVFQKGHVASDDINLVWVAYERLGGVINIFNADSKELIGHIMSGV
jgi:tetratricopeptide (TPR) repeat protein